MSNFTCLRKFWNLPSGHQKGNGAFEPVPDVTSPDQLHLGFVWWKPVSLLPVRQFFAAIMIFTTKISESTKGNKKVSFYASSKSYPSFVKTPTHRENYTNPWKELPKIAMQYLVEWTKLWKSWRKFGRFLKLDLKLVITLTLITEIIIIRFISICSAPIIHTKNITWWLWHDYYGLKWEIWFMVLTSLSLSANSPIEAPYFLTK